MKDCRPLVSIIMNCLNGEKYLKEAIDSVYIQTYSDWEIVFWDNASTDKSAQIAKSYDERLRYFRGKETIPLGAARNKALEQGRGEFIAFLDCDDLWLPGKLEKQIPLFADHKVGLVYSDSLFFNARGKSRRVYSFAQPESGMCFPHMLTGYFLSLETVVIRRTALDGLPGGWFDPRFNMIEEMDVFTRIACRWKLAMINEVLAKWRVHSESVTWRKGELLGQEMELFLDKLSGVFPGFDNRYQEEIVDLRKQITFRKAVASWKDGSGRDARRELTRMQGISLKGKALYLASYLPAGLLLPLYYRLTQKVAP